MLSAAHVVADCRSPIVVRAADGSHMLARVLALDVAADIALLAVPGEVATVAPLRSGQLASAGRGFAVGFPERGSMFVAELASGQIEAERNQPVLGFVGPLRPGNSGGPVLDAGGAVVGIVSAALTQQRQLNRVVGMRAVLPLLVQHGVPFHASPAAASAVPAGAAAEVARRFTVRVECES